MENKCKKAGHHVYLTSNTQGSTRWCVWCNAQEEVKKPIPKKKQSKRSTKKK